MDGPLANASQPALPGSAQGVRPDPRRRRAGAPAGPTSPAPPIEMALERRAEVRRPPAIQRGWAAEPRSLPDNGWIPQGWPLLLLAMLVAICGSLMAASDVPSPLAAVLLCTGASLLMLKRYVRPLQDHALLAARLLAVGLAVLVPLFLFGMGITLWASSGGLPWDAALATMLAVGTVAAAYLHRHPAIMFGAQLALWTAAVVVHVSLVGVLGAAIGLAFAVLVTIELRAEARREAELREARERVHSRARDLLSEYEQTGQGWFWETDRRALLTYVSPPVARLLERPVEALLGHPLARLFNLEESGSEGSRTLNFHLSARSPFNDLALRAATAGEERWWSVTGRPVYDSFDNFVGFRGWGTDLTEKRRSQEYASRLAHYDSLTGLANRFHMAQALEKILQSPQEAARCCAVMLLDLDRFKHVNDTLGHPAGDALLRQVAQRLERTVGRAGQVGRLGGDEFKVIVPNRVAREALGELARAIIHALSQPYSIDGHRVVIGASVGIALAPDDGHTCETIIRNADLALYAAKDGGRGRFHFYSPELLEEAAQRAQLEEELRDALLKGELTLHYQPVVATATEKIAGFEALLRWRHPVHGWVNPARFITVAEESGLITQIGEWALRQACHDLAQWPEEVRVAVNVSPLQFASPQLPAVVTNAIAQAGIDPSRLELEITESVFLSDNEGTDAMFAALKRIGVRLALDDFGTGYSSLGYLKKAPFDKIKIDQSFVRGATEEGSRNGAIIASITSLAHALGMDTIAEGVETLDELDLVRMHGCTHVQGYIYERPLSREEASQRLACGLTAVARGPRSARAPRQTMLRKVLLEHEGQLYNGTIRNISTTGALIEGLWNVPVGTIFNLHISQAQSVACTTRWSAEDRMGVEFATPLQRDAAGRILVLQGASPATMAGAATRQAG